MPNVEWRPIATAPAKLEVMLGMFLCGIEDEWMWCQTIGTLDKFGCVVYAENKVFYAQEPTHWHELLQPPGIGQVEK